MPPSASVVTIGSWTKHAVVDFAERHSQDVDAAASPRRNCSQAPPCPLATHSSEIQYLCDQPNAPFPATLNPTQEALAASMRTAWANFAANGDPTSTAVPWPSFSTGSDVLSLATPRPRVQTSFATTHDCPFWAAE
jgi:carboxylesterase type B